MDASFDADRFAVIERSLSAGVSRIIEVACSSKEWAPAVELCAKYPGSMAAVFGVHPHYTDDLTADNAKELAEYLKKDICVGIGEIGLDYYWDNTKKAAQAALLEAQLELSNTLGQICVFHARNGKNAKTDNAYSDLAATLKKKWSFTGKKRARGVLHCFSGSWEDARAGLDHGLFLGINGTFTYKNNAELRETVKKAGIGNIVLETDCPYLPVQSMRGKRNDPSYLPEIARAAAEYMGMRAEEFSELTTANAAELFSK